MKSEVHDLIMKFFKISQHKSSWFKKIITMFIIIVIFISAVFIVSISFLQMTSNANLMTFMSDVLDMTLLWNKERSSTESAFTWQYSTAYMMILEIIILNITNDYINSDHFNFNHFNLSVNEIILLNEITVHRFSEKVIEVFRDLINNYSILFINISFVDLFEENWMRIFLKIDWKFRIFDKAKIYLLSIQNKVLIDVTFDQLHDINKLSWIEKSTSFSYSIFCV